MGRTVDIDCGGLLHSFNKSDPLSSNLVGQVNSQRSEDRLVRLSMILNDAQNVVDRYPHQQTSSTKQVPRREDILDC